VVFPSQNENQSSREAETATASSSSSLHRHPARTDWQQQRRQQRQQLELQQLTAALTWKLTWTQLTWRTCVGVAFRRFWSFVSASHEFRCLFLLSSNRSLAVP